MGYKYIANTENEQKLFKSFEDLKNCRHSVCRVYLYL